MGVFIDPMVDWAFKRIFGEKDLLIDFLNSLFEGEHVITDLRYLNNEREGEQKDHRKVLYDLYCTTDNGEYIIVEMQNRLQEFFKDRALFYSSRAVMEQGQQGKWNFELMPVYGIFFVNFLLDEEKTEHFYRDVTLVDQHTGKVFNNKFRQIFIELPRFRKSEADCENFFDCWIYNLVNMKHLDKISFKDEKAIFARLEEIASRPNLTKEERARYEYEWKKYNDYFNTMDYATKKATEAGHAEGLAAGLAEGRAEGMALKNLENARTLKSLGVSFDIIMKTTGLNIEEIEKL